MLLTPITISYFILYRRYMIIFMENMILGLASMLRMVYKAFTNWSGWCYCKLYLHEDCTFKLPSEIWHPSSNSSYTLGTQHALYHIAGFCLACKGRYGKNDSSMTYWSFLITYKRGERIFHGSCFHLLLPSLKREHHPRYHLTYFKNPREFLMSLKIKSDSSYALSKAKILTAEEIRWRQKIQAMFPPQLSNHPLHSQVQSKKAIQMWCV